MSNRNVEKPCVIAAISGSSNDERVVRSTIEIAEALNANWEAIHVEIPGQQADRVRRIAAALSSAQSSGGTIIKLPAPTAADGIEEHLRSVQATHLVLGRPRPRHLHLFHRPLAQELAERLPEVALVIVPADEWPAAGVSVFRLPAGSARAYAIAAGAVVITLVLAELLMRNTSLSSAGLLFLFPVIAVAARQGLGPTLLAVALSVLTHNILFLPPALRLNPFALQSWLMAAVLAVAGIYTNILTSSLRARLRLSDRSARESARIATFAQRLTRLSGWDETGAAVCEEISVLLDVHTVIFRELAGRLSKVADFPDEVLLDPLDIAALEWTWRHGEMAGMGTDILGAASWQFHPLKTSLGTLAVLGIARVDGAEPVTPDQTVLLSTLIAQAALAHERLRLEEKFRAA